MNEKDDMFKKFHDSFKEMQGHFHILEERVPVERQVEYFKYSDRMKQNARPIEEDEFELLDGWLTEPDVTDENRKFALTRLAISHNIKAYRALEKYVQSPDSKLKDWAHLALMESRITLESELSEEKQIYISTGLGGKNEKLRFFVLLQAADKKPFEAYQRQVIEREFAFYLEKADCEIEQLDIKDRYGILLFLLPIRTDIKALLDATIAECNQFGNFLSGVYTVTNVKELSEDEIIAIIDRNGNVKASH